LRNVPPYSSHIGPTHLRETRARRSDRVADGRDRRLLSGLVHAPAVRLTWVIEPRPRLGEVAQRGRVRLTRRSLRDRAEESLLRVVCLPPASLLSLDWCHGTTALSQLVIDRGKTA